MAQQGHVERHGNGWRGKWREDGHVRSTRTVERKGEAIALLHAELDRIRLGEAYQPRITLAELADRFLAQYNPGNERTRRYAKTRLSRPRAALGDAQARDVTTEALQRLVNAIPGGKAYRRDVTRTLRMVYAFGITAGLVRANPAAGVKAPAQVRSERILPFESWDEVEAVAAECGRWGPLVIFLADTGARPHEAIALQHRHVDGAVVELPGTKTPGSWRSVRMTERGIDAVKRVPRSIETRHVFHIDGRPISWVYFWREVWRPAVELAQLAYRPPYNLRHTFAYWSLRAGVPIATVAREMGHTSTEQTFKVYGGWCREMGVDAAAMRSAWATRRQEEAR